MTSNVPGTVYLDRDGTVVDDPGYLRDPADLRLLEGAAAAVARLNRAGLRVVLVTNQSGIGRGYMQRGDVEAVHRALTEVLRAGGAHLDAVYYCPHRPDEGCRCRKPGPGLVERARRELGIGSGPEFVIGDKEADVGLAWRVGARPVLVRTGEGAATEARFRSGPAGLPPGLWVADDLGAAAGLVLAGLGLASPPSEC